MNDRAKIEVRLENGERYESRASFIAVYGLTDHFVNMHLKAGKSYEEILILWEAKKRIDAEIRVRKAREEANNKLLRNNRLESFGTKKVTVTSRALRVEKTQKIQEQIVRFKKIDDLRRNNKPLPKNRFGQEIPADLESAVEYAKQIHPELANDPQAMATLIGRLAYIYLMPH